MIDLRGEPDFDRLKKMAREISPADEERVETPDFIWKNIEEATSAATLLRNGVRRFQPLLAAAAVLLVALVAVGVTIRAVGNGDDTTPVAIGMATLTNAELPVQSDATAAVELVEIDGGYALDIDLSAVPDPGEGVLELWVIDTEVAGMFTLGAIDGDGLFELPEGVDPAAFPVVDISVEPLDGDPTHSGQSVLRGVLDLA